MSLISSMNTAANGLEAHSNAMGIISDNLANINTVGYKESLPRFTDVMAKTAGGVAGSAINGQGSQINGIEQSFLQGALLSTGAATDLAIQGDGFFVMKGVTANGTGLFYSRAGQFKINEAGTLVNYDGLAVQGYTAPSFGVLSKSLGDITVQTKSLIPPKATENLGIVANLNPTPASVPAWNVAQASGTSNFSTSVNVIDSLGGGHEVQIYFRNAGPGSYEWHALVDGGDLTGGTQGTPVECANGMLSFDSTGKLTDYTTATNSFDFEDATPGQVIAFNLGDPITTGGTGTKGVTDYTVGVANASGQVVEGSVTGVSADGFPSGAFQGMSISADGLITGSYTNGHQLTLGQVAVAKFPATSGLLRIGQTLFVDSPESGQPAIGAPLSGGRGSVTSGSLEQSNVNLSSDFIQMMAYQRGFQANSRTVHTSDQMMQELVNLGR